MTNNNSFLVRFSQGTGRNLGKATNLTKSWKNFKNLFRKPDRSSERLKDYLKLPDKEQSHLKGRNGWFYRTQIEGKSRNRKSGLPSDLVTLDFDYATPELLQALIKGKIMPEWEWFLQTSRRHTPENPRFRLFIALAEPVTNELYNAVSRIVASYFDPEMVNVDKVSFRPAQMMYMPTASADSEFVFHENEGELVDWSELLDTFELTRGDWRDVTKLPKCPNEQLRETAEKMEDPAQKPGIVGDFCRAYDIFEAIAAFELPYEAVDDGSPDPRFTYMGGTTYNGAIVYDDGKFLYSHHGSDPVADMEVNAFDLVRLHKFGDLDDADEIDKKITQRASWKAMVELCRGDKKFKAEQVKSRYDLSAMNEDFEDMPEDTSDDFEEAHTDDEDDEDDFADIDLPPEAHAPTPSRSEVPTDDERVVGLGEGHSVFTRKKRGKPDKDWMQGLALTQDGFIQSNLPNVTQILDNDMRTRNALALNEHMQEIVLIRPLRVGLPFVPDYEVRDQVNGDLWVDGMTAATRTFMEAENGPGKRGYGFKPSDRDMKAGLTNMSRQAAFHPIQQYLNFCADRYGANSSLSAKSRVESLWTRYLGSPDDSYHRDTALKFMVACVARAFEPGHKFDYSPIMHGAQGVGKSTFVAILAQHWYGELSADFSNHQKLVEQMQGCWIMELPELSSITRGQIEDVKAFISGTGTKARLAYNARAEKYLRQTCFIGSTNDTEFLIDSTGNRRWWPIEVMIAAIDLEALRAEVDLLWGAAVLMYREMRAAQPEGYLPLFLSDPESRARAEEMQEEVRVETDVDLTAAQIFAFTEQMIEPAGYDDFSDSSVQRQHRSKVCVAQLRDELDLPSTIAPNWGRVAGKALKKIGWHAAYPTDFPPYGKQRVYTPSVEVMNRWAREWREKNPKNDDEDDFNDLV